VFPDSFQRIQRGRLWSHPPAGRGEGGETLLLNSGEVCAYLTQKSTFGLIDTFARKISIVVANSGKRFGDILL